MNLGKYVHHLLKEYETVIVPGFGAFVSSYKPAEFDEASEEIRPPSKAVSFNPKIRNNDGLLVGLIAAKEGISYAEALEEIEKEREDILYTLDKGEKATFDKVGFFYVDESRQIQFESFGKEHLLLDSFGLGATSLKEEPGNVPGKEQDAESTPERKEPAEMEAPKQHEYQEETQDAGAVSGPSSQEPEHPSRKKNRGWLWFLLILVPLIVAGFFILKKEKDQKPPVNKSKEEPPLADSLVAEEYPVTIPDSAQKDTFTHPVADSTEIMKEPVDSANYLTPDSSKYYLVVGSFKEKENAEMYLEQFKKEGYDPFHLGRQGNFYIVGIDVFASEREAFVAQYDFLEKNPDSGVWVYKIE